MLAVSAAVRQLPSKIFAARDAMLRFLSEEVKT
jgi:hypothetical protein